MNFLKITKDDMLNGDGIRAVLWVAGCHHACKECHNKETWNPNTGREFTEQDLEDLLEYASQEHVEGITLTGGDPLYINNIWTICYVISMFRKRFGDSKTIWLYTGYTFEELMNMESNADTVFSARLESGRNDVFVVPASNEPYIKSLIPSFILKNIDILCEGKFDKDLKDANLMWVGSSNQRVIDMKKTISNNMEVILYGKDK